MNRRLLLAITIVLVIIILLVRATLDQSIRVEQPPVIQSDIGIGNPVGEIAEIERSNLLSVRSINPPAEDAGSAVVTESTFDCERFPEIDESIYEMERSFIRLQESAIQLEKSTNPEHLALAAKLKDKEQSNQAISLILRALDADAENPVLLWSFMEICGRSPDAPICSSQSIENRVIKADYGNGMFWARIAGNRMQDGDLPGGLTALRIASTAPQITWYWIEQIEMYERGMAASFDTSYANRVLLAIGLAATSVMPYSPIFNACRSQATVSAEWFSECLSFGERLERDEKTLMSLSIGVSLQKAMYEISGDEEKLANAETRLEESRKIRSTPDESLVVTRDERVLADYLSQVAAYGEIEAIEYLQKEVERLKSLPGYDPCAL